MIVVSTFQWGKIPFFHLISSQIVEYWNHLSRSIKRSDNLLQISLPCQISRWLTLQTFSTPDVGSGTFPFEKSTLKSTLDQLSTVFVSVSTQCFLLISKTPFFQHPHTWFNMWEANDRNWNYLHQLQSALKLG